VERLEHRTLGDSGLKVPVLSFGTATFGGNDGFELWGETDVAGARRIVDVCLEAGVTMFDTANSYSNGRAEEILGEAIRGRRDQVLISTKATTTIGPGPNERGSSRLHVTRAVDDSLRRLRTDWIDLFYMHWFDGTTPVEEVVSTLDTLVRAGKLRYVAASNFPGWALMKSLAAADRYGWSRYVGHQVQYSLAVRQYEYELCSLGLDQGVGAVVWSPLAMSALTGKIRRGREVPRGSRLGNGAERVLQAEPERIYRIVDVLDELVEETGRSITQIALNWLLRKPTVATLVLGARTEEQLRDNIGAVGWSLSADQVARLDRASAEPLPYPYRHQREEEPFLLPAPWTAEESG
jgi:aryl-alcohol dehydrogenase-like predicted oxidoreductase